jgi:hypothetical protein
MLGEIVERKNRELSARGEPASLTTGALLRQWAMERILAEAAGEQARTVGPSVWDRLREMRDEARKERSRKAKP